MDPLKTGQVPLTTEWFETQKKMLKQAGIDKQAASEKANDTLELSEAAKGLPSTKQDKFLESVKPEILKLDPEDGDFVSQATSKLVDGVLGQEYGEHFTRSSSYKQMHLKIARTILGDPNHRENVESFLSLLLLSSGRQLSEHLPPPQEEDQEDDGPTDPA